MFKFAVVAFFLCAQAYARPSEVGIGLDPHIVGGTEATEGQYPFIVTLRTFESELTFCGGALISNRYVLTAAHCVYDRMPMKIGAGSVKLIKQKIYDVLEIILHPDYDREDNTNDIALLKLEKPIKLGGNIQLIKYPVPGKLEGRNVTALGWGQTSTEGKGSPTLMHLKRPVITNKECQNRLNSTIIDSQICLGGEKGFGMCFGDSGSPLMHKGTDGKNYIAGVVSWGIPCAKGYPDVFTRVSSYVNWIKENMS